MLDEDRAKAGFNDGIPDVSRDLITCIKEVDEQANYNNSVFGSERGFVVRVSLAAYKGSEARGKGYEQVLLSLRYACAYVSQICYTGLCSLEPIKAGTS